MRLSKDLLALVIALALPAAVPAHAADRGESAGNSARDGDEAYLAHVGAAIHAAVAAAEPESPMHLQPCIGGMSGGVYPCSNIDLMEFMSHTLFATDNGESVKTNSLWGWTDPQTGHEWVLLGLNNGTAFIDITDPENPLYAGKLPSHNGIVSLWRDVREYSNYAYVVVDQGGAHGMQVFDLNQLRDVLTPPVTFTETAHYAGVTNTHTISINKDTGYAYLVGSNTCSSGLHIVNLFNNPASPQFVGCYNDGGYVHENQCFVYHGPDTTYTGHEICLAARGYTETLDIIDVTNHAAPVLLDSLNYNTGGYSHQAWFTDDQRYILLDDELDEQNLGTPTRTWIFDALYLNNLVLAGGNGYFEHATSAIDHNLYVRGDFVFESNYRAGLRILRLTDLAQSQLTEIAYFDLYPTADDANYGGTWNNYPFFASGIIPVTHMEQGLFLLRPTNLCEAPGAPTGLTATGNGDHRIDLDWTASGTPGNTSAVERALGGCSGEFVEIASGLTAPTFDDLTASGGVTYGYRVTESDISGLCSSAASACVEASTTGSCTAAPVFAGIASATNGAQTTCQVTLAWAAGTSYCGGPTTYSVYRGATDTFLPAAGNRIAQGLTGLGTVDLNAPAGTPAFYIVRATDVTSGSEETNLTRRSAVATCPLADGTFATGAEIGDPTLDTFGGPIETEALGEAAGPSAPEHAGWHLSTDRFHTGARSFFSTSSSSLCVSLEAGPLTLTDAQSSQLTFWTGWDIETGWDGGIVEISTDGGATWTRLTPVGGYPDVINNFSDNACAAMPPGTPAFSSAHDPIVWQQKSIDLLAYAGLTVRLAWRYGSDPSVNEEGWYVDDIALTHAQIPSACISNLIFAEDHESGGFGAWSNVFP